MNEDIRIIIRAITEQAQREIDKLNKNLENIDKNGKKAAEDLKQGFSEIGKKAAVAVASVAAMVTALSQLAKTSAEAQRSYGRLVSAFANVGLSADQAQATFSGLFRFLGDVDTATEASNLLAQLTTDTENLAQWQTILQGVYATFPDSIPVEALAEAANETAKVGQVTGALADALNWVGVSEEAFNAQLATLNTEAEREALIRSTLLGLYGNAAQLYEINNKETIAFNEAQAKLNTELAKASAYLTPLLTALTEMAAVLLQAVAPVLQMIVNILIVVFQWVANVANAIASLFGKSLNKASTNVNTINTSLSKTNNSINKMENGFDGVNKKAEKLKRLTMGFDELNILNDTSDTGDISGGGGFDVGSVDIPTIDPNAFNLGLDLDLGTTKEELEEVRKRIESILVLAGLVAAGIAAWKIIDIINDPTKSLLGTFKLISGYALIIAGALLLIQGYSDAWVNGIDWGNFVSMIGGIVLIAGGLALAVNPLAAGIAAIVGGIALLIIGIKDFVENGYSMQNVLTILAGVIAIVVGVCLAFNAALLANPITWIIIGIAALVAAFVILWNECEGFRNFWINLWDKIKSIAKAFADWFVEKICKPAANIYKKWIKPVIDKIIEIVSKTVEVIGATFVGLWNLLQSKVITPIANGFSKLWQGIKNVFAPVTSWFSDVFGKAWKAVQNVFKNWGSFFSGLWDKIKQTFSKLGTSISEAIGKAVKSGINGIIYTIEKTINRAISIINGAIGLINKLPGVSVSTISTLSLPRLAKGGIVDTATIAMIGERGKEAVLPLENNTQWMDKLADKLSERNNTPSKIVLTLDGKALGWANINSINDITRQTGNLPLVLA